MGIPEFTAAQTLILSVIAQLHLMSMPMTPSADYLMRCRKLMVVVEEQLTAIQQATD